MKLPHVFAAAVFAITLPLSAQDKAPDSETPTKGSGETEARTAAYDLAGAFSNDGYKIRDGFWFAPVEAGKSSVVQVNLFAGDEYWFCAAANPPATKIDVTVYDEFGAPVEQQHYEDGARAAAGVVPVKSGPFYVKVSLLEGEKSDFCLIYCYK